MTNQIATNYNTESAAVYGNRCRVAIGFAISCDSDTEALYAYLNARWAARLALAEMNVSARVLALVDGGMDAIEALRTVCGDTLVDSMIESLYIELRAKAVN